MRDDALASAICREIDSAGIPGLSCAVVDGDHQTETFANGWADLAARRQVTAETVFRLYSGTKIFTATAIMQLQDRGILDIAAPLRRYLPEALADDAITIRHLLNHTSGLRDTMKAFLAVHPSSSPGVSTTHALSRYALVASEPPGTQVRYRNVNYALLGEVVSRLSGMAYEAFVTQNILRPLNIKASFGMPPASGQGVATGYVSAFGLLWMLAPWMVPGVGRRLFGGRTGSLRAIAPYDLDSSAIGGLAGEASAFASFLDLHMNGNENILGSGARRAMQSLSARGQAGIMSRDGVGLGWKLGEANGACFLNHEGGGPGFTSELRIYPQQRLGIALLMNRWALTPGTHRTAHRICEAIRLSPRPRFSSH